MRCSETESNVIIALDSWLHHQEIQIEKLSSYLFGLCTWISLDGSDFSEDTLHNWRPILFPQETLLLNFSLVLSPYCSFPVPSFGPGFRIIRIPRMKNPVLDGFRGLTWIPIIIFSSLWSRMKGFFPSFLSYICGIWARSYPNLWDVSPKLEPEKNTLKRSRTSWIRTWPLGNKMGLEPCKSVLTRPNQFIY